MERKKVNLLWTGGWDSSFRFLQLMQQDIDIQPVYIIDADRKSNAIEQKVIRQISGEASKRFKGNVLPVKCYEKNWILENCRKDKISADYKALKAEYHFGTQYEWIALLLDYLDEKMELCAVYRSDSRFLAAFEKEGNFGLIENDFLQGRRCLSAEGSSDRLMTVFGRIVFPLLDLSKKNMEMISRENGWIDLMEMSWFCHSPINGKPCGLCVPCNDAIHQGMEWRLPKEALCRNKFRKLWLLSKKIEMKLKMMLKK